MIVLRIELKNRPRKTIRDKARARFGMAYEAWIAEGGNIWMANFRIASIFELYGWAKRMS